MEFPVYINLFTMKIHPHILFETIAYFIAGRIYFYQIKKQNNENKMGISQKILIISFMMMGAIIFSMLVSFLQNPIENMNKVLENPINLFKNGKTIVGGLFGGIIGVEIGKKIEKIYYRTGDNFVLPIIVGIMIGRIGCFLTGFDDPTVVIATKTIFGMDFGDGIKRHPTQLYEIIFFAILFILYCFFKQKIKNNYYNGFLFQLLMLFYFTFRFFIDFIKPYPSFYLGLNSIQVICIITIVYYIFIIKKELKNIKRK